MLARRSADAEPKQEEVQGRNYDVHEPIYSNDTDINQLIDQILTSRREGRILNDYDQVYADGNIDQALMQGNDMQARNLVRDKLCSLGLMSCEPEGKRQYYSTIYAQAPPPQKYGGGPYGPAKPMPPPGFYNGRPPMGPPPSSVNSFGPPRKVGYESSYKPGYRPSGPGGNYNGPYLESPPPSAIDGSGINSFNKPPPGAIIYGSKPPGPVYTGGNNNVPPYTFENPDKIHGAGSQQTNFYSHQSSASASASQSSSTKVVVGGTVANAVAANAALQQHVHHHFHHVDGGDSTKVPSVPIPVGSGQTINTDFSALAQSSTAFTPQTQGSFAASQGSYNAGFNAVSQGGLLTQTSNGFKPSGGDLYKPGGLSSFGSGSSSGSSSHGYGSSGFGSSGSNSGFSGSNFGSGSSSSFGSGSNSNFGPGSNFGSSSNFGSGSNFGSNSAGSSYHSQNPDYYKKELHNVGGIQASSSSNFNSLTSGYGNEQSLYSGGYDTSRNQFVDCQCVPFNQCPAADRIGRKEDLILPIDPRNLGKDIEALSDEAAANITISANPEKKDDSSDADKSNDEKKRSKREADKAEDKQSDDAVDLPLDAEGVSFSALCDSSECYVLVY